MGFLGGSVGKESAYSAGVQERWVRSLGQEDPLKEGIATHSSILTWRMSRAEKPGGQQAMGLQRVGHD